MTETVICEKCGSIMLPIQEEHTCGYSCPICGNGWVTTYFSPIESDATVYDIIIEPIESPTVKQIKAVSKVTGCNSLAGKDLLNKGGRLKSARARDTGDFICELRKAEISFTIHPPYPYDI